MLPAQSARPTVRGRGTTTIRATATRSNVRRVAVQGRPHWRHPVSEVPLPGEDLLQWDDALRTCEDEGVLDAVVWALDWQAILKPRLERSGCLARVCRQRSVDSSCGMRRRVQKSRCDGTWKVWRPSGGRPLPSASSVRATRPKRRLALPSKACGSGYCSPR